MHARGCISINGSQKRSPATAAKPKADAALTIALFDKIQNMYDPVADVEVVYKVAPQYE